MHFPRPCIFTSMTNLGGGLGCGLGGGLRGGFDDLLHLNLGKEGRKKLQGTHFPALRVRDTPS